MKELIRKILREQEREKMKTVSLPVSDPWPEFRKQNAKRFKDMIDAADWELFLHGLEIPEEDSEEPQVIKDLNTLVKAIEDGKKDNQLIRTKEFKRLNLDKDKIAFWRNHLNKPEVKSVWARTKSKIKNWLGGNEDGDVTSKEEVVSLKEHIKRILREQTSIQPSDFCSPIEGELIPSGPHSYHWGHPRKNDRKHAGVDMKAKDGDTIRAPYGGEVEYAIEDNGYGCGGLLVINHGDGVRTRFCHVSKFIKEVGDKVNKGEKVAEIGGSTGKKSDGNATGPHLHYEIHTNSENMSNGALVFATSVDPESGWLDNLDCDAEDSQVIEWEPQPQNPKKVRIYQELLLNAGYLEEGKFVIGLMDIATVNAIKELQDTHGLTSTGEVDTQTLVKLMEDIKSSGKEYKSL